MDPNEDQLQFVLGEDEAETQSSAEVQEDDPYMGYQHHDVASCKFCSDARNPHPGEVNPDCHTLCKLPKSTCPNPFPHDFKTCVFRKVCSFCTKGGHDRAHCYLAPENAHLQTCQICYTQGHAALQCPQLMEMIAHNGFPDSFESLSSFSESQVFDDDFFRPTETPAQSQTRVDDGSSPEPATPKSTVSSKRRVNNPYKW